MSKVPEQRRLAAIMIADVVGYSRLMELDEAGTFARLKSRRASILTPISAPMEAVWSKSWAMECSWNLPVP